MDSQVLAKFAEGALAASMGMVQQAFQSAAAAGPRPPMPGGLGVQQAPVGGHNQACGGHAQAQAPKAPANVVLPPGQGYAQQGWPAQPVPMRPGLIGAPTRLGHTPGWRAAPMPFAPFQLPFPPAPPAQHARPPAVFQGTQPMWGPQPWLGFGAAPGHPPQGLPAPMHSGHATPGQPPKTPAVGPPRGPTPAKITAPFPQALVPNGAGERSNLAGGGQNHGAERSRHSREDSHARRVSPRQESSGQQRRSRSRRARARRRRGSSPASSCSRQPRAHQSRRHGNQEYQARRTPSLVQSRRRSQRSLSRTVSPEGPARDGRRAPSRTRSRSHESVPTILPSRSRSRSAHAKGDGEVARAVPGDDGEISEEEPPTTADARPPPAMPTLPDAPRGFYIAGLPIGGDSSPFVAFLDLLRDRSGTFASLEGVALQRIRAGRRGGKGFLLHGSFGNLDIVQRILREIAGGRSEDDSRVLVPSVNGPVTIEIARHARGQQYAGGEVENQGGPRTSAAPRPRIEAIAPLPPQQRALAESAALEGGRGAPVGGTGRRRPARQPPSPQQARGGTQRGRPATRAPRPPGPASNEGRGSARGRGRGRSSRAPAGPSQITLAQAAQRQHLAPVLGSSLTQSSDEEYRELSAALRDVLAEARASNSVEQAIDAYCRVSWARSAQATEDPCKICQEPLTGDGLILRFACMHASHATCVIGWLSADRQMRCPDCNEDLRGLGMRAVGAGGRTL